MIDFHTHILPGIDDGSRDMDMTEQMLIMEKEQGVSHIFATPHFYAHRRSVDFFLERRDGALKKVQELLNVRTDLPRITPGAEVYYFSGMGRASQLTELCVQDTDILLLELPFDQWHSDILKDVEEMIFRKHLRIVLAHLDRYERFQKDTSVWDELIQMPLTIQLNCESFMDHGGLFHRHSGQKFCLEMLSNFDNVIIGSDCHNLTDRAPNILEARNTIEKKAGRDRLDQLDTYTLEFLGVI